MILFILICAGVGVTFAVLRAVYVIHTSDWDNINH